MRILFINEFGQSVIKDCDFTPSMGHKVDIFSGLQPVVVGVLCYPTQSTLLSLELTTPFDAIITVN